MTKYQQMIEGLVDRTIRSSLLMLDLKKPVAQGMPIMSTNDHVI